MRSTYSSEDEDDRLGGSGKAYNLSKYKDRGRSSAPKGNGGPKRTTVIVIVCLVITIITLFTIILNIKHHPRQPKEGTSQPSYHHPAVQTPPAQTSQSTSSKPPEENQDGVKEVQQAEPINQELVNRLARTEAQLARLVEWKEREDAKNNPSNIKDKLAGVQISGEGASSIEKLVVEEVGSTQLTVMMLHDEMREQHYFKKMEFMRGVAGSSGFLKSNQKARDAFMLAQNNFRLPHSNINVEREINKLLQSEENRLSRQYDFKLEELPFCIIVPTINNAKAFRYQYNLQSMVNLNYRNYKIVIIDDASNDNTYELILQFIREQGFTQNITVVKNKEHMTAVPNIHKAATQYCDKGDIGVLVDGDDEMLGRHSLKVFNHIYQKQGADMVWSNHIQFYQHTSKALRGWSMSYSQQEKDQNRYRDVPQRIAHLRSFKIKLFLNIKEADLKEDNGEWFTSTYDEVICLPMLEMTCGRNIYVDEYFYLYNFGIGTNDLQVDGGLQKRIANKVKKERPKYGCLKE